jgi:hypothetical protein
MYNNSDWTGPRIYLNGITIKNSATELKADIETLIDRNAINTIGQKAGDQ